MDNVCKLKIWVTIEMRVTWTCKAEIGEGRKGLKYLQLQEESVGMPFNAMFLF